jgi:probable HAF family extracellular repeat protein
MTVTHGRYCAVFCVVLSSAVLQEVFAEPDPPSFEWLGGLPGPTFSSSAASVSEDGNIISGGSLSSEGSQAFVWMSSGGISGIGDLPGNPFHSFAKAVSADGSVIVGYGNYVSYSSTEAFRWINGSMQGLGFPQGMTNSWANDVSSNGATIAIQSNISGTAANAYIWTELDGFVQLPFLTGGVYLSASAISADGNVITGTAGSARGYQAYRWTTEDGTLGLGDLAGGPFFSWANGISADGTAVVGYSYPEFGIEAFRWKSGEGMIGLGILPGADFTEAFATNADGSIVVGVAPMGTSGPGANVAFIWDEHYGMRSLRQVLVEMGVKLADDWLLGAGHSISADGRTIVGFGYSPNGNFEAYRARLRRPGDANSDGVVNVDDLLSVINEWGDCPPLPTYCPPDVAPLPFGDGTNNVDDLLMVINNWTS